MNRITIILSFALLLFLISCSRSEDPTLPPGPNCGDEDVPVTVSFRVNVPGQNTVDTRALLAQDETRIDWVDALVFDQFGKFLYRARTHAPVDPGGGQTHFKEFDVDLLSSGSPRIIHFIANAKDAVDAAALTAGDSEEDVFKQIETGINSVNTPGNQTAFPFPMWGTKTVQDIPITGLVNLSDRQFKLLRSVARIDVGTGATTTGGVVAWAGLSNFELTSARVFRAPDRGRVVPKQDRLGTGGEKVTSESLPLSVSTIDYGTVTVASPADFAIERSLYLYEREAGTSSDCLWLIISGSYDGGPETFYKIELRGNNGALLPLLRNHNYRVNIKEVTSKGHATEAEALANNPLGTRTEISVENIGLRNSVYDEQHHLSTDKLLLDYHREEKMLYLLVETNHPDGVVVKYKPGWITIKSEDGLVTYNTGDAIPTGSNILKVTAAENNADVDRAMSVISFAAGRLELDVEVAQGYLPELDLIVEPATLVFYRDGNPQIGSDNKFEVRAMSADPSVQEVTFAIVSGNWSSAAEFTQFPLDDLTGNVSGTYHLEPSAQPAMTANKEGVIEVTLSVPYGVSKIHSVTRQLKILQLAQDAIFLPSANNPYPQYAGTYQFSVISELAWAASVKTDTENMMDYTAGPSFSGIVNPAIHSSIGTGGIILLENNSFAEREATLGFVSAENPVNPSFPTTKELVVRQAAYPLVFNLTSPLGADITMRNPQPGNRTIGFTLNSSWTYTIDGSMAGIGTFSLAENTVHTPVGVAPNAQQAGMLVLTPTEYSAQTGTPAAGELSRATLRVVTEDHLPQDAKEAYVTIARYVPSFFDYKNMTGTLGREGGPIQLEAETNAQWYGTWSVTSPVATSGTSPVNPASAWDSGNTSVNIPENTTWASRDVTIGTMYYDVETLSNISATAAILTQTGYFITEAKVTDETYPSEGGSATVSITGDFPNITIQTRTSTGVIAFATVSAGTAGSEVVEIPANNSWTDRTISVGYVHPNGGAFVVLETYTQPRRYYLEYSSTDMPSPIPGEGGTYTLLFTGQTNANFQVRAISGGDVIATGLSSSSLSQSITIPENIDWNTRIITFEYYNPGSGSWETITGLWREQAVDLYETTSYYFLKRDLVTMYRSGPEAYRAQACHGSFGNGWMTPTRLFWEEVITEIGNDFPEYGFKRQKYISTDPYWTSGSVGHFIRPGQWQFFSSDVDSYKYVRCIKAK